MVNQVYQNEVSTFKFIYTNKKKVGRKIISIIQVSSTTEESTVNHFNRCHCHITY